MALIGYSGFGVNNAAGKAANFVYSRNTAGPYVKELVPPSQPDTIYQQYWKAAFASVKADWATLTMAQQLQWNQVAESGQWNFPGKLGTSITPTGEQLFVECNLAVYEVGGSFATPPGKRYFVTPQTLALTIGGRIGTNQIQLQFDVATLTADTYLMVWATDMLSTGISRPQTSLFKRLTLIQASSYDGTELIGTQWASRFGGTPYGGRLWIRTQVLDYTSGQRRIGPAAMIEN